MVDLDDLLDERGGGVEARIGGEQPGGIGEQDEQVGRHEVGHQGGQPVVVPEPDLVIGDGVVLVDHGDDAQLQEPFEGGAGVQVLLADHEVVRHEQHLAGEEVMGGQGPLVDPHEPGLADRGHGLQRDGVAWAASPVRPTAGNPAAMAPEVTSTTVWPAARSPAASPQSLVTAASTMEPASSVIDDVPTFTTTITNPPRR